MGMKNIVSVGTATLAAVYVLVNFNSGFSIIGAFILIVLGVMYAELSETTTIPPHNRSVLITGCDTGFGHELAHYLESIGMTVFAGCLDENSKGAKLLKLVNPERLHVLQLDVTKQNQVDDAILKLSSKSTRGLWGLVNNAGLNFIGEAELTTMDQYQQILDVNVMGMIRMVKACMPLLRETKGRIVNITSIEGLLSLPYNAANSLTKVAGESFSDILRMEVKKWGVNVCIVEPCNFSKATEYLNIGRIKASSEHIWDSMNEQTKKLYGKNYLENQADGVEHIRSISSQNVSPVIDAMADAILSASPQKRYLVSGGSGFVEPYRWLMYLSNLLPETMMDRLLLWKFGASALPDMLKLNDD